MTELDHRAVLAQLREINAERSERMLVRCGEQLKDLAADAKVKADASEAAGDRLVAAIKTSDEVEAAMHHGKLSGEEYTDQANRAEAEVVQARRDLEQAKHDDLRAQEVFRATAQQMRQEAAGVAH